MNYSTKEEGSYLVLGLEGELDLSCSPEARKYILQIINNGQDLMVDLSKVTYLDSSGVASLIEGYQSAKNAGQKFGLLSVTKAAMSVLQLARLDEILPIHSSIEEQLEEYD